jgi:phage shock protein PspC (stress-responsive transcriptional regulator)
VSALPPQPRPLRRSRSDRMIAGVCAGLAHHFGLGVTLVRVLYVLVSILSAAFPGILVYIVLWIVIPEEPAS